MNNKNIKTMKKLFTYGGALCIAAATMMCVSCSNEITETSETVQTKTNVPVKVRLYTGQSSRAAETTLADVARGSLELVVYKKAKDGTMTNLNASYELDANGNLSLFTLDGTEKYLLSWPTDGSTLVFTAQYGAANGAFETSSQGTTAATFISDTFDMTLSSATSEYDVVTGYAESTLAASTAGVVNLTLSHMLTELNVTCKAPDANITYTVNSIEMTTMAIGAKYAITTGTWTPNAAGSDPQVIEILSGNSNPIDLTTAGVDANNTVFVYPDAGAKLSITYSAKRTTPNGDMPVDFGNGNLTNTVEVELALVKGEKQRYTITLPSTTVASAKVVVDAWPAEENTDKAL